MSMVMVAVIAAGFLTAALSGVAGLGGGTILIGLFYAVGMAPAEAVPLFAAVQLVANASRTAAYVRHVEWRAAGWFLLAAVPATFVLAPLAAAMDADVVCLVLALLILLSLLPGRLRMPVLPARLAFVSAGVLNGALGLFIGAMGLVVGRLFMRPEWERQTTIGTLAMTNMLGHGLRVAAYGVVGFSALAQPLLLGSLCVAVVLGTIAGRHLNGLLDERTFERLFRWILIVLSLKLLFDGVRGLWWN